MSKYTDYLDRLQHPAPCSMPWEEMSGDERMRFCGSCQKSVHNLEAYSGREAESLLAENNGDCCTRILRDRRGRIVTRSTGPVAWLRRNARWPVSLVLAGCLPPVGHAQTVAVTLGEANSLVQIAPSRLAELINLRGVVTDATGSVVPNAVVTAVLTGSAKELTATTDNQGNFRLTAPSGEYKVVVQSPGFRTFQTQVQIPRGKTAHIEAQLQVGSTGGPIYMECERPTSKRKPFFTRLFQRR